VDLESPESREITTIMMEIQQIMKGNFSSFMHKEIFEQPESVVNTMRGTRAAAVFSSVPDP
jgi:glucosamine--fructose-6-phosphate aminotransferase (isomerizing)